MLYTTSDKRVRSNIILAQKRKPNVFKSQIKSSQQDDSSTRFQYTQIKSTQAKSSQLNDTSTQITSSKDKSTPVKSIQH